MEILNESAFLFGQGCLWIAVRPQHVQRYQEYANIYKEEEEERSERWTSFLQRQAESAKLPINGLPNGEDKKAETSKQVLDSSPEKGVDGDVLGEHKPGSDSQIKNDLARYLLLELL